MCLPSPIRYHHLRHPLLGFVVWHLRDACLPRRACPSRHHGTHGMMVCTQPVLDVHPSPHSLQCVYFFHTGTGESVWEAPDEVAAYLDTIHGEGSTTVPGIPYSGGEAGGVDWLSAAAGDGDGDDDHGQEAYPIDPTQDPNYIGLAHQISVMAACSGSDDTRGAALISAADACACCTAALTVRRVFVSLWC
jgi:hypothetical protein